MVRASDVIRLGAPVLTRFGRDVLVASGMTSEHAETVAECLVTANVRGVDTHGVLRLLQYATALAQGEVNPRPVLSVTGDGELARLVDADGGYGYVPTILAARLAAEIATSHGVGVAGVRNSHHFGMAATYVEQITDAGQVGIVLTNTSPVLASPGVPRALVGNNPIAIGIPTAGAHDPIVLDMALSQVAFGRIRLAAVESREIPEGWAFDSSGQMTTDPKAALAAGLLSPVGGYKGLGLAIVVDILAGVLTGSPAGLEANAHRHRSGGVGHLVIAIAPDLFVRREHFFDRVERLVADFKAAGSSGAPLLLPGEAQATAARERLSLGIPVSAELCEQLAALGARLDVPVPTPLMVDAVSEEPRVGFQLDVDR